MNIGRLWAVWAVLGLAATAGGDTFASATARVTVIVSPSMAVSAVEKVTVHCVQAGPVEATVTFLIEANLHRARLYVEASDLYKGSDPSNSEVAPIPLDTTAAARIEPASAAPADGGANRAGWVGAGEPIGTFETHLSETLEFVSAQDGRFSQEVDVTLTWNQDDPDRPLGTYGGMVRLTALAAVE